MAFVTSDDLKADTLRLADEVSSGSPFDSLVYDYLTNVQDLVVSGGRLGEAEVPLFDWYWARKYPRGGLTLLPENHGIVAGTTVQMVTGGTQAFLSQAPTVALADFRLILDTLAASDLTGGASVPVSVHINNQVTTTLTIAAWPFASITTTSFRIVKLDYDLASDFLRFVSPLYIQTAPHEVNVTDVRTLEAAYPHQDVDEAVPALAALIGTKKIRLSHYPAHSLRAEYEYIVQPTALTAGTTPTIPQPHRRILSFGAAYLILVEKGEAALAAVRLREFWAQWHAMQAEARRQTVRASNLSGVVLPRWRATRSPRLTESGIVMWP